MRVVRSFRRWILMVTRSASVTIRVTIHCAFKFLSCSFPSLLSSLSLSALSPSPPVGASHSFFLTYHSDITFSTLLQKFLQRDPYQKNTTLRDDMTQSHNLRHRRAVAAAQRRAPVPEPQLGFDPTAIFGGLTRTRGRGGFTDFCEN